MTIKLTTEQINSCKRVSERLRKAIDEDAKSYESDPANHKNDVWENIRRFIPNINRRYCMSENPIVLFEIDMHDLWYEFFVAAMITDAHSPEQDRLAGMVVTARESGTLKRPTGEGAVEEAVTSDGSIWTDLPYLVGDMRSIWEEKHVGMSVKHRTNLASFMARLMALGICGRDFGWIALSIFKDALEATLTLDDDQDGRVPARELLPACFPWLKYSSHKLVQFVFESQTYEMDAAPGKLAREAGVEQSGFSMERWLFWRRRYKDLSRAEDADIAKEGEQGFNNMIGAGRMAGYVKMIPGEENYWTKVEAALGAELKRSGKPCVEAKDIIIDKDWADA